MESKDFVQAPANAKIDVDHKLKDPRPIEDQFAELKLLIAIQHSKINQLTEGTPFKEVGAPDRNVFENIKDEVKSTEFWENYQTYSPIMFCFVAEKDRIVSSHRDDSVTSQILKSLGILQMLHKKIQKSQASDFDLFEYTHAVQTIRSKVDIIEALKAPTSDPKFMRLKLVGTDKYVKVDLEKLRTAVKFYNTDGSIDHEKQTIQADVSDEDKEYLEDKLKNFEVVKTKSGSINLKCMMKMMSEIATFAARKGQDITREAQISRLEYFEKDNSKYIDMILETLKKEEENYDYATKAILAKLEITHEQFQMTEREIQMDPMAQMEFMEKGMMPSEGAVECELELERPELIRIIKESNDRSVDMLKEMKDEVIKRDVQLVPFIISCLSHDFITNKYSYEEVAFKACMLKNKALEDPELSQYLMTKQFELMNIMGPPPGMQGMPGMPPGMEGMGGMPQGLPGMPGM